MKPRVAIVTGGARGLGFEAARRLNEEGYAVVVADIDVSAAKDAALEIGDATVHVHVDVRSTESVDLMIDSTIDRLGGIDVLINNAGTIDPSPTEEVQDESWHHLVDVHLGGTFRCSRSAFPALKESPDSAIVNMASLAAHVGIAGRASYCAAKAGIEGLTRELAVEWAPHGIRVNAVAPGYIRTGLAVSAIQRGLLDESRLIARTPLGRMGEPSDVAAAVVFLASEEAGFITGQTLIVDGGHTINGNT